MTYSTVELSKLFEHRYKFVANVYDLQEKKFLKTTIFLDTGCYNTMIPRLLAKKTGRSLGFKMKYSFGASAIEAEAFSIEKCTPEYQPPNSPGVVRCNYTLHIADAHKNSHLLHNLI